MDNLQSWGECKRTTRGCTGANKSRGRTYAKPEGVRRESLVGNVALRRPVTYSEGTELSDLAEREMGINTVTSFFHFLSVFPTGSWRTGARGHSPYR